MVSLYALLFVKIATFLGRLLEGPLSPVVFTWRGPCQCPGVSESNDLQNRCLQTKSPHAMTSSACACIVRSPQAGKLQAAPSSSDKSCEGLKHDELKEQSRICRRTYLARNGAQLQLLVLAHLHNEDGLVCLLLFRVHGPPMVWVSCIPHHPLSDVCLGTILRFTHY